MSSHQLSWRFQLVGYILSSFSESKISCQLPLFKLLIILNSPFVDYKVLTVKSVSMLVLSYYSFSI